MSKKVAIVVGSLRKASWNRKVATELIRLSPDTMELEIVEIGELPLYNEDLETNTPPPQWTNFRTKIESANGVLFVTPEYNRTVPGGLKNAIDVGSRPYISSVWKGKPAAIISASTGAIGGFGSNHVLRQSLVFLGMPTLPHEAYIGGIDKLFDGNGVLAESTENFLKQFLGNYENWLERF